MTKRIYWETVKKWAIITGVPVGVASFALLFMYLSALGVIEVTGYSGDMVCDGTNEDPCLAFVNFTAKEDVFIYPVGYDPWGRDTPFYTDIGLKSWKMYRSWGTGWREIKLNETCTGTWCGAPNNLGVAYSFVFREGRDYQIKIVAFKEDPKKSIKWGFGPVDPIFYGSEDNKLNYSTNDKVVEIRDALDKDIAKIELISHEDVNKPLYVNSGKDRRVMIYKIENLKDFDNALGNVEIINMKDGLKENKEFHFEYAIYDNIQRPVYEDFCEIIFNVNGSVSNECERRIVDYTYNSEIVGWNYLNSTNILKGNITIALVTDVEIGDHYDGIFTLFGKKIDKHAEWSEIITQSNPEPEESIGQRIGGSWNGMQIVPNVNISIISMGKYPSAAVSLGAITNTSFSLLTAETSIINNNTVFATPFNLTAGTSYLLVFKNVGGDFASYGISPVSFPINTTYFNYSAHVINGAVGTPGASLEVLRNITFRYLLPIIDEEYPQFTSYTESPDNNTVYSLGANYFFNVTITHTNGTAGLDFNSINYSVSNISSVFNTTILDLSAGTYSYYWWAYGNGSLTRYNTSGVRYYTIAKKTPTITKYINGADSNLTIQYPQQVNVSSSTDLGTLTVYRDGTDVTSENGVNISLASGYHNYWFNVTGNQNVSNLSEELYVNITRAIGEVYTWINNTRANYSVEIPANRNIWLNATLNSGEGDVELRLNGTIINSGSSPLANLTNLSYGFYNVTAIYSETQNYTSDREVWWVNISGIESVNISLEEYFYDIDVELGTNITINATINTLEIVCVDIDHPDYGVNYSCLDWNVNFELFINYFRKLLFSDGSSEKTFNFSSLNTSTDYGNLSINAHRYDEVDSLQFNISGAGNPRDIFFYLVNTSTADRAYQGRLINGNIRQDKFYSGLTYTNLTYSNPGESVDYIYLDDNAKVSNFTLKISGVEYGFDYYDPLDDWDDIDTDLTTAQLDKSGVIMLGNSSLTEFSFDDFENGNISDHWFYTTNYDTPPVTRLTEETDGYLRQYNKFQGTGYADSSSMSIYPNVSHMNMFSSEDIKFSLYSTYDSHADNVGCWGTSYVILSGKTIWTAQYINDDDTGSDQIEDAEANVSFILTKNNKTSWRVQIFGFERSDRQHSEGQECGFVEGTWNWTNSSYYISKADCADESGSLDSDFYIDIDSFINYPIEIYNDITFGVQCLVSTVDTKIYYVNNSLWYRQNSSVTSKSIFDSSSNIAKATLTANIASWAPNDESTFTFMSADNGEHWEAVTSGVEHSFSNPGKHIKWKINLTTDSAGYTNDTTFIRNITISTPKGFPTNVTLDFGNDDIIDYTINGTLNASNSPYTIDLTHANFSGAFISTYQLFDHTYSIPLIVESDSVGQINLDSVNLTYDPNPIILNKTYVQNFLDLFTGFVNFSIPFSSSYTGGNITISDLNFDYKGGNDTIKVLAHNSDYSINLSRNITYFYSDFYKNLPYTWSNSIFFLPRTNSSKNVSAYGQTDVLPIFNITTTNYCGKELNISIRLNESFSCLNVSWNITGNTKPNNQKLSTSWLEIFSNLEYLNNSKIWFWADLDNCDASNDRILNPTIDLESYCESCIWR